MYQLFLSTTLGLGLLIMQLLALAGMYYLTKFSFNNVSTDNKRTIELTDTQLNFTKLAVVLFWIQLAAIIFLKFFASNK